MKQKSTSLLLLLMSLLVLVACSKSDDPEPDSNMVELTATLDGRQQVPANNSTATGTFAATYNKDTRELSYTVIYQGLKPVAGHVHIGAPGKNGPHAADLPTVATSPITAKATISEADGAKLLAGESYMNLHSAAFPDGEIRGNITVK